MRHALLASGAALVIGAGAFAVPALAASKSVTVKNFKFTPKTLTVKKGTKVTWKFGDTVAHNVTVTSGPVKFHSKNLAKGKSFSKKLTKAGTYKLVCTIHPNMTETVKVK